ncbi:hypothetical protein [Nocardia sp. alder85J]|uniref:hypothetical protein n=1 Tax=Nocardia sp. alder85J TaxID=2862949 RepID=UPI001CD600D7|nr:hypothetical protein [Nocardia sp. alder85J]MCX4093779.1 hypothetical protein [Nocardia sp. alder85J]
MKFGSFAALAVLTVTTVGIGAGTVCATPTPAPLDRPDAAVAADGADGGGVGYHVVRSDLSREFGATVTGGRFALTGDQVTLTADTGEQLTAVPLTYRVRGATVHVAQQISDDGHTLVLEPKPTAGEIGEMQPISSTAQLATEINENVVGVVAGGVLGGLLGTLLGMGFFSLLTGPVGLLVGAIAGGYVMGGQPFLDAVTAVLTGQP